MIPVVIPSAGRAKTITTHRAFARSVVCIPAAEEAAYRASNPELELMAHPDSVKGISLKRQWIYEKYGDVLMVDDDVRFVTTRHYEGNKNQRLTKQEANDLVDATAESARELGVYLFGFGTTSVPTTYNDRQPIRITGFVAGYAMGLLKGSKLWFPAEAATTEDMWISALNAHFHRLCFVDERYGMNIGPHWSAKATGGMALVRTNETEKEGTEFLRRAFGSAIVRKQRTALAEHSWARSLRVPW